MIYVGRYPEELVKQFAEEAEKKFKNKLKRKYVAHIQSLKYQEALDEINRVFDPIVKIANIQELFRFSPEELREISIFLESKDRAPSYFYNGEAIQNNLKFPYKEIYDLYTPMSKYPLLFAGSPMSYGDIYEPVTQKIKMSVLMTLCLNLQVCPYCNRTYINYRGYNNGGAQLDHILSKNKYPIFASSINNLVPTCGTCNLTKGTSETSFSPFIQNEGNEYHFSFDPTENEIGIDSKNQSTIDFIESIRLKEAYQIHRMEAADILKKLEIYNRSQKNELQEVIYQASGSTINIEELLFGKGLFSREEYKRYPLAKLRTDILRANNFKRK
ncbi:HNH endonuclease [Enterococcus sp. BWR-S5]|uniref:HNH endonuclease n=1 Tax=Enterococcus sp. BWR-S5 TaxID=2787714 RepID=UPI0019213784|nr:HNH endonuclease [Enterococcus sp. BWR-S5]MBL1224609.1 HNH endonuclease [Enterococcus sp. BWR-S5]